MSRPNSRGDASGKTTLRQRKQITPNNIIPGRPRTVQQQPASQAGNSIIPGRPSPIQPQQVRGSERPSNRPPNARQNADGVVDSRRNTDRHRPARNPHSDLLRGNDRPVSRPSNARQNSDDVRGGDRSIPRPLSARQNLDGASGDNRSIPQPSSARQNSNGVPFEGTRRPRNRCSAQVAHIAIEAAFPSCALYQCWDSQALGNNWQMEELQDGNAHRKANGHRLWAGSQAEGLCMESNWGHGVTDRDIMRLYGGELGVRLASEDTRYSSWFSSSISSQVQTMRPTNQEANSPLLGSDSLPAVSSQYIEEDRKKFEFRCLSRLVKSICIPISQYVITAPRGDALLVYRPRDCPNGYCRLEVDDPSRLIERINRDFVECRDGATNCISFDDDGCWLHSQNLLHALHGANVSGPAGQSADGLMDLVPTLVFSGPHPSMESFCRRCRGKRWPINRMIDTLRKLPLLHVLVGHKSTPQPKRDLLTRFSWSPHEMYLLANLPTWIKQGYVAFKYTFKSVLRSCSGAEITGRSHVGSYHLKTTLLHTMEENPPSDHGEPFDIFLKLLGKLQIFLTDCYLPNYFMPECNLLETVGREDREHALNAVQDVSTDPLGAILWSPIKPTELYSTVEVRYLVEPIKRLNTRPDCEYNRRKLHRRMRRMDNLRASQYERLVREKDKNCQSSNRPELIRLADLLDE